MRRDSREDEGGEEDCVRVMRNVGGEDEVKTEEEKGRA